MTNGDYIRQMDNNDLAGMLVEYFVISGKMEENIPDCHGECPEEFQRDCKVCARTIKNWLDAEKTESGLKTEKNDNIKETIADRIKKIRNEKGMSQTELAKIAGESGKTAISKLEHAKDEISFKQIKRIAKALNCSLEYLMGLKAITDPLIKKRSIDVNSKEVELADSVEMGSQKIRFVAMVERQNGSVNIKTAHDGGYNISVASTTICFDADIRGSITPEVIEAVEEMCISKESDIKKCIVLSWQRYEA